MKGFIRTIRRRLAAFSPRYYDSSRDSRRRTSHPVPWRPSIKRRATLLFVVLVVLAWVRISVFGAEPVPDGGLPTPKPMASPSAAGGGAAGETTAPTAPAAPAGHLALADVLERYTMAIGSRQRLGKIHTSVSVSASILLGRTIITTTTVKAPVYYRQVTEIEGTSYRSSVGFDGKTAWLQDASGAVKMLSGLDRAELISGAALSNATEVFPNRWPTTVSLKPLESVDDRPYVVLSVKAKGGMVFDILLDPQTYRPEIERHRTTRGEVVSVAQSFGTGPLGELQWNVVTESASDGIPAITSVLRSVKDNVTIDNSIFAPPLGKGGETI